MTQPTRMSINRSKAFPNRIHGLGPRTLLFFIAALSLITAVVYAVLNHELQQQASTHTEILLREKASALGSQQHSNTESPVYYHWGSMQSAQGTIHWPNACSKPSARDGVNLVSVKCRDQIVTVLETELLNPNGSTRTITLWASEQPSRPFHGMELNDLLGMGVFVLAIAILASAWINRSIVKPLRTVAAGAMKMSQGDYNFRLAESNIDELNQLSRSFNHMAKTLQERETLIRCTAYKDQLTGLNNRAFLTLALRERIEKAREPLTILTWGIDNLDGINEVLGHEVAEKVLVKAARKSRRLCRDNIVIARLEGHVYCVVMPTSMYQSSQNRKWLQRLMQGSVRVGSYMLDIHSHGGVALFPQHGEHPEHLLRRAEIARQLARKTGQSVIQFETRMETRSAHRLELIAELKNAITHQEFCLYYQPKLNLRTNTINQAEVLLRWNHPTRGIIAPGGFIELAEQTGMIRDITRWVMTEVYAQTALCQRQNVRLSMNLSALDLEDDNLLSFVRTLHDNNPQAAKFITLEITESAAMRDPDHALELLNQLSDMGFQIAIDDFGTGYSSLSYLKKFPVTELKIDRSLVQGADLDADSQIILESTIQMGHIMGLLVTTEGVEHDGEFDVVRKLGVDYVQGFWLSKPMPYEEFRLKHLVGNHDQLTQPI